MRRFISVLAITLISLSGCGGGGSSNGPASVTPPTISNQSVGGIWTSTYTVASGVGAGIYNGIGIATESGQFYGFTRNTSSGCASLLFGQLNTAGSTVTGTGNSIIVQYTSVNGINPTCTNADGSVSGTMVLTGSVTQRQTLNLTSVETTSAKTVLPAVSTVWSFSNVYNQASSLSAIAGNYKQANTIFYADVFNINSNGVVFGQDPTTKCVFNGQIGIINASYDVYNLTGTFSNCVGNYSVINGISASGLVAKDTSQTPAHIIGGLSGTSGSNTYTIAFDMVQQ